MTEKINVQLTRRQMDIIEYFLHWSHVDQPLIEFLGDDGETDQEIESLEREISEIQRTLNRV